MKIIHELTFIRSEDIGLQKFDIRWMMRRGSASIKSRGCLAGRIREDNGFSKKLCSENQIATLSSSVSFFPRKISNSVFRE